MNGQLPLRPSEVARLEPEKQTRNQPTEESVRRVDLPPDRPPAGIEPAWVRGRQRTLRPLDDNFSPLVGRSGPSPDRSCPAHDRAGGKDATEPRPTPPPTHTELLWRHTGLRAMSHTTSVSPRQASFGSQYGSPSHHSGGILQFNSSITCHSL